MEGTLTQAPMLVQTALTCGTTSAGGYTVRPATPGDTDAIRDFVSGLSVRTQYFRFFTAVSPPSRGLLRALAAGNTQSDILLVTAENGAVIGHGMAVDASGDRAGSTDIGLVVADCWQGLGLGTELLRLLAGRAAARGVRALLLEVLPDNARMLGIIDRRWPDAERRRTPDAIAITARIAGTPAVPADAARNRTAEGSHEPTRSAA